MHWGDFAWSRPIIQTCLGQGELFEALLYFLLSFHLRTLMIEGLWGIASKCITGCAFGRSREFAMRR
jgi:hypothetical protein